MKWLRNLVRSGAVALVLAGASFTAKPAQADGGAVVAGIAGGLILGTLIGATANATPYYSGGYYNHNRGSYYNGGHYTQPYYAPVRRYYAPPTVSYSYNYVNTGRYYRPHKRHYGHRSYRKHRPYRGYRGYRGYRRGYHH